MSGVSSSSGDPNSGSSDADGRVANDGARALGGAGRDSSGLLPNSASKPDDARLAVPASIKARSSRPSTAPGSCLMGKSGRAKLGARANSYPQLRHRSALSKPT
jgi:hypothetical protein